ncbi:tyrosine-type recombinase/integrase [Brevundimonas sp. VNH65]|uniref:tyrosine-type recombinase/integrase n=1 Tax=Brevundimonas sp. VNH65 TaxID=3400917 RepID=UPI003C10DF7C
MLGFDHVTMFRDRHGKARYRYRRKGQPTVYLPGVPGSPDFAAAYEAARNGARIKPGAKRTIPGTIDALAVALYESAEWSQLAPTSRTTYRGIIEQVRRGFGDLPVARLTQANILTMRDKKAATPTAANNLIRILRWMLAFAVSRQMIRENPAAGIKPLKVKSDGHRTWTEEEISSFEAKWKVGTRERTAFDLLLYTAQRVGDVRRMGRQHVNGDAIRVRQEKTGVELDIPLHPRLKASLAKVAKDQMLFLVTQHGVGFTAAGFGNWFRDACRAAGVTAPAHGIRKSALTRLADAGATESQIMAVSGHQTSREVRRYTLKRDQRRLAKDALALIGGTDGEQTLANPAERLANPASK